MAASAWAVAKAEELLIGRKCPDFCRDCSVCAEDRETLSAALTEAEARGASRLRERIRERAERLESESAQAEGDLNSMTAFVTSEIARELRELEDEG